VPDESQFTELIEYIVKALVDHPEEVSVSEIDNRSSLILEVSVADDDMGRVIGKGGVVVNSIRTLVQVLATKKGKRVSLEIV
jgi:predicted RNA-binding protein YlqC (UPF0109 family)